MIFQDPVLPAVDKRDILSVKTITADGYSCSLCVGFVWFCFIEVSCSPKWSPIL